MAKVQNLRRALDILTQGAGATVRRSFLAEAAKAQEAAKPWTMGRGIQGLGIGRKITGGQLLKGRVLKVYVEKKLPKSRCDNLVPKKLRLPGVLDDIPTDVEAIGRVELESDSQRLRPALPGCSIGHPRSSAGTFGCLVRKVGQVQALHILSNSHVLALNGFATVGDEIIQPGKDNDGSVPQDVIAALSGSVPFEFSARGFPNLVDAAIAKVKKKDVKSAIPQIGLPKGISKVVREGMRVQKTGCATGYTLGVIRDVDYLRALNYSKGRRRKGRVGLKNLVLCTRYTADGDSGSAVLNMQGKVVGLHFAGSPSSSIFCRISHVFDALGIELVTDDI